MNFGAEIGAPGFNAVEFNEPPQIGDLWTLYLDDGITLLPVYIGYDSRIPANRLYPNSEYLFRRAGLSPLVEVRFSTPPAIAYDGLGG